MADPCLQIRGENSNGNFSLLEKSGKPSLDKRERGLYLLVLRMKKIQKIQIGKLPEADFKAGIYLYVGRARTGLKARIKRHLQKEKKLHWHIDYFLKKAEVDEIWIKRNFFDECLIASKIREHLKYPSSPAKKFGSSDCGCLSHLFFLPQGKAQIKSILRDLSFEKIDMPTIQV